MEFADFVSNQSENDMTTKVKIARRKLSLLELASELSNVSRACKVMGYYHQEFLALVTASFSRSPQWRELKPPWEQCERRSHKREQTGKHHPAIIPQEILGHP